MEGAGQLLDRKEIADDMKESGFATLATRPQIIKHLLALTDIVWDTKDLKATAKVEDLLNCLKAACVNFFSSRALMCEYNFGWH
jgi:hypothetical protein